MLREDNTGFVNFPHVGKFIDRVDDVETLIYLVAFETQDLLNKPYILSNCRLNLTGNLISDDVSIRNKTFPNTVDDFISDQIENNEFEMRYFPNNISELQQSIPLTTCICLGWNEHSYEFKDGSQWVCSFRDLTHEGQKLYYSIKKLHNNKEVRILTFNNI